MITKRPAAERGIVDHGWLLARHSFSFASYQDPHHVRFRTLRVINEDTVQPAQGFGTHGHEDMEILTYVLAGAVEHRDSMGEHGVLRPGDVQVMSAGTGVLHSEVNPSATEPLHLLQIWIFPDRKGHEPRYEDRHFPVARRQDALCLIASGRAQDDALPIHQDARVYASLLSAGSELRHALAPGRGAWVQVARGSIDANGTTLTAGDGAAIEGEAELTIRANDAAELLLFDLA
ncbi:MAG: pirin family protein [Planctomycetes bacterium]|nr:pirin family protein [Planctomycetota bacterium]